MKEIVYASATNLAQAIRARRISSTEVVLAHLGSIERLNPKLNAVVQLAADAAMAQAKKADEAIGRGETWGPLHGVPITIKDGWETEGPRRAVYKSEQEYKNGDTRSYTNSHTRGQT